MFIWKIHEKVLSQNQVRREHLQLGGGHDSSEGYFAIDITLPIEGKLQRILKFEG